MKGPQPKPPVDRFWPKVRKSEGCWLWTGGTNGLGYGILFRGNRKAHPYFFYAHRFSWELLHGPITEGMQLDHLCRNPSCVNPEHLEVVTPKENYLRGVSPPAMNARKRLCALGHEFRTRPGNGKRYCPICSRRWRKPQDIIHPRCPKGHPLPPLPPGRIRRHCAICP